MLRNKQIFEQIIFTCHEIIIWCITSCNICRVILCGELGREFHRKHSAWWGEIVRLLEWTLDSWQYVRSFLLYRCETWKTTPPIVARMQIFNCCLRRIRLTVRSSNDEHVPRESCLVAVDQHPLLTVYLNSEHLYGTPVRNSVILFWKKLMTAWLKLILNTAWVPF